MRPADRSCGRGISRILWGLLICAVSAAMALAPVLQAAPTTSPRSLGTTSWGAWPMCANRCPRAAMRARRWL